MKQRFAVLMFCSLFTVMLTACGDDPDVQMQRIRIALDTNNPDQALALANDMLDDNPEAYDVMALKAQAHLRLAQLQPARQTLEALAKARGNEPQPRRLLVDWSNLNLAHLLEQSDFASSDALQQTFDSTLAYGQSAIDWLHRHGEQPSQVAYHRARLAQAQADRLRLTLFVKNNRLSAMDIDGGAGVDAEWQQKKAAAQKQIDAQLDIVQAELDAALAADGSHTDAMRMLSQLLMQRQRWAMLWDLAGKASHVTDLPAPVAESVIAALLAMPDDHKPVAQRLALGQQLLAQVHPDKRAVTSYRLAAARIHLRAGEPDEAKPLLAAILKRQARHTDARYLLAQCYYQLAEYDRAMEILKPLAVESRRSPGIQTLYGMTLAASGDMGGAKEALRRATELNPQDPAPREAFLTVMMQLGHVEAAQEDIEHFLSLMPNDPRALSYKLRFEMSQGRNERVMTMLNDIGRMTLLTAAHVQLLMDGYNYLKQYDRVEALAKQLTVMEPDSLVGRLRLIEAQLMQGHTDSIEPMLASLRDEHGDDARVIVLDAHWRVQQGKYDQAAAALDDVVAGDPSNTDARLLLARCFIALTRNDEALTQINAVIEQNPGSIQAHALAARVYQITGDEAMAGEHLSRIDTARLNLSDDASLLAQIKLRQGAEMDAVAIAEQAVRQGSRDPIMRFILAAYFTRRGDFDRAETQLLNLIELDAHNATGYAVLARFYAEAGRQDDGVKRLRELRQADDILARLAEATLYLRSNQTDAALQVLLPAFDPGLRRADQAMLALADAIARIYVMRGALDKPYAVYQAMIDAKVQAKRAMLRQIDLHRNIDGESVTIQRLETFMQMLGSADIAMRGAGIRRYAMLGQPKRAEQWLDQWTRDEGESVVIHLWQGDLRLATDRAGEAITSYEKALALAPDNAVTHARLAHAYEQRYDFPAAEKAWRNMATLQGAARTAALTGLGRMYLRIGLSEQASQTFASLDRAGRTGDPAINLAMGQSLLALKEYDQARRCLEQVPVGSRQYAAAQLLIAREDLRLARDGEAQRRLEDLMKQPQAQTQLAKQLLQADFNDASIRQMAAWTLQKVNWKNLPSAARQAWLMTGVMASIYGQQWQQAEQILAALRAEQPPSHDLAAAHIALLASLGRTTEAGEVYRTTPDFASSDLATVVAAMLGVAIDPHQVSDPLAAYCIAASRGDQDAIRTILAKPTAWRTVYRGDLQTAASTGGKDAPRLLIGAVVASRVGMQPLAVRFCEQAIAANPQWTPAHAMRLGLLIDHDQPIAEALRQAPRDGGLGLFIAAREHDAARNHSSAAAALEKLVQREPQNDLLQYMLAKQWEQADQPARAMAVLSQLAKNDGPVKVMAVNDLAYLIVEHDGERLDDARRLAREALQLTPNSAPLLDTLGWIEFRRGQREEALRYLSRAAPQIGTLPEVQYHLGAVYRAMGNDRWARYYLQAAARGPAGMDEVSDAQRMLRTERLSEVSQ